MFKTDLPRGKEISVSFLVAKHLSLLALRKVRRKSGLQLYFTPPGQNVLSREGLVPLIVVKRDERERV